VTQEVLYFNRYLGSQCITSINKGC